MSVFLILKPDVTMKISPSIPEQSLFVTALLLILTPMLHGCGEFTYKRGASVGDLENAKRACQSNRQNSAAMEKCLEQNGWVVQRFDETEADPVADVSVTPDNHNDMRPAAAKATTELKSEDSTKVKVPPAAAGAANTLLPPAATPAKPVTSPLDIFKISSWWKLGGGPDALKLATDECVAKLGEANRPNIKTQEVTRGMLLCMRDKGWSGLRAK